MDRCSQQQAHSSKTAALEIVINYQNMHDRINFLLQCHDSCIKTRIMFLDYNKSDILQIVV